VILRREVSLNVKTPRSLFLKFPFGAPLGPASDAATQRAVIEEALQVLVTATESVAIVDSEKAWKK
jgi:D-proline reductase (dithiol) PrdB